VDDLRFDNLARVLGAGISRRRTLSALGAALSGGTLLAPHPNDAAALSRKKRRQCKQQGGKICSKDTKRECCSPSGECLNGACQCDPAANDCPQDDSAQCECTPALGGVAACCDSNTCCDIETTCDSNLDCLRKGSFCSPNCNFGGFSHCTNPCIPGGSSA